MLRAHLVSVVFCSVAAVLQLKGQLENVASKHHTCLIFSHPLLFSPLLTCLSLFFFLDVEEQTGTPSACMSEELHRRRAEEQVKQLQLEESHREEVERLRAHYQQQATETEERYLTELLMLQQQLQDVTSTQTHSR